MSDMPDDVYKNYSIRSEFSLLVEFKQITDAERSQKCGYCPRYNSIYISNEKTSILSIENKTWFLFISDTLVQEALN